MTNDSNTADVIETAKTVAVAQAKARQAVAKKAKAKKPAKAKAAKPTKAKGKKAAKVSTPRADSKQARFIAAMQTAKGMSIDEAAKEFGWQKHTVRGAVAGGLKTKLGLKVEAERDEKRGTVYRIK